MQCACFYSSYVDGYFYLVLHARYRWRSHWHIWPSVPSPCVFSMRRPRFQTRRSSFLQVASEIYPFPLNRLSRYSKNTLEWPVQAALAASPHFASRAHRVRNSQTHLGSSSPAHFGRTRSQCTTCSKMRTAKIELLPRQRCGSCILCMCRHQYSVLYGLKVQ